jgi:hypothetical protein
MSKAASVLNRGDRVATLIWIGQSPSRKSPGAVALLYAMPVIRRDRAPCLSSKITIATGRASIIREPDWLNVPVPSVLNVPVPSVLQSLSVASQSR